MADLHKLIAQRVLKSGNCLCVLASGLCESLTVSAIIQAVNLQSPRVPPLVIVVSTESAQITGETPTEQRERIYSAGGSVTVTCRVLLSDILCHRLDAALINAVIIPHAHEVTDTSNEAFFVRLFRERNGTGSLIALSEKPHAVSAESLAKILFLSDIVLVPRFHEICVQSFSTQADFEISQHDCPLGIRQVEMQSLLESLIVASITEIKKNKLLANNLEDLDAKTVIANKKEIGMLRRKLDPVWLRLSWTTRQIVSDVGIIRKLLVALTRYDSVTFLSILLTQQEFSGKSSPWWFAEDAQRLVRVAKDRVADLLKPDMEAEIDSSWMALNSLLQEINNHDQHSIKRPRMESTKRSVVLVVCPDDLSAKQVLAYISEGPKRSLLEALERADSTLFPTRIVRQAIDDVAMESFCFFNLIVKTSGHCDKSEDLIRDLSEVLPHYIVLMEPSLVCIRCIELHRLIHASHRLEAVHVLGHAASLVEPKINSLIGSEAKAFDDMIRTKSTLTMYSRNELFEQKQREASQTLEGTTSTRRGGRRTTVNQMIKQTVLVDIRELRSALPLLLYRKNLEIYPTTLTIGDYILSRDIAVERKSVTGSDLQQSLVSGRLYKQMVNLTHAFPWPMLLLEFSTGKTFQLQASETSSGEINPASLIAQIVAVSIHFPSVRLIWSPSFAFTANVFNRLKQGREQPRIDVGSREPLAGSDPTSKVSSTAAKRAVEFLKACPGITAANLPAVMKRVKSVRELVHLELEELVNLLGKRDGHVFHKFINFKF